MYKLREILWAIVEKRIPEEFAEKENERESSTAMIAPHLGHSYAELRIALVAIPLPTRP
jgi:hypothetical protein